MKPGALEESSVSRMLHCLKCKAAKSTNKSDAKKIKYGQSAQVTIVPVLLVFHSIHAFAKSTQTTNKGVTVTVITWNRKQEASPSHFLEYKMTTMSGPRYCSMQTYGDRVHGHMLKQHVWLL